MTDDQLIAAAAVEAQLCRAFAAFYAADKASGHLGESAYNSVVEHRDKAEAYLKRANDNPDPFAPERFPTRTITLAAPTPGNASADK